MATSRRFRILLGVGAAVLTPIGIVLALIPQVILRVKFAPNRAWWCGEHAPEWIDFPPGEQSHTSWEVLPAGVNCHYNFEPFTTIYFDMGSGFLFAGLIVILLGIMSGVLAVALSMRASRPQPNR